MSTAATAKERRDERSKGALSDNPFKFNEWYPAQVQQSAAEDHVRMEGSPRS